MSGLGDFGRVDRRLPMLGADNEQRGVEDATVLERLDHIAERLIGLLQTEGEHRARCAPAVDIAARLATMSAFRAAAVGIVLCEFLSDADRLEGHAEDRRGSGSGPAVMGESIYFVDDGRHLQRVVGYRAIDADCS